MEITSDVERRAFAKVAWRLLPILTAAYVLNHIDRNNIGFAALTMNRDIGLTPTQFGTGAGILFLGYCLFEIPSNVAMYHIGARVWISRIMITWGMISAATVFVTGPKSFYLLRLFLGIAEAGFFPGVAFYLAIWFPAEYRARVLAWFLVGIPASSVIGGPISGLLLGMGGIAGIAGWKWLFILEGLPVLLLGIAALWVLADRPEDASWLTQEEQGIVRARIRGEQQEEQVRQLLPALKDVRVLILAGAQFGFTVGSYGIVIWLPQIIKAGNVSNLQVGFASAACYLVACIGMIAWAGRVDRTGRRIGNLTLACLISTAGLLFGLFSAHMWVSLSWLTVALVGITAARAIFWTIPTRFLSGLAAAAGFAFINSVGTIGGFVGPVVMGWLKDRTHSFSAGLMAMAGFLLAATILSWSLKFFVTED